MGLTKSAFAFLSTCETFFKTYPHCYYWTLTFKEPYSFWRYQPKWQYLHGRIVGHGVGKVQGIKVVEVHPGEYFQGIEVSHGLHYHLLMNRHVDISWLQSVGVAVGLGRCSVSKVIKSKQEGLAVYLAKYLSKGGDPLLPHMKRWTTFGGFEGCRKRDVVVDSAYHRNMWRILRGKQARYNFSMVVRYLSDGYGEWDNWPIKAKMQFPEDIPWFYVGKKVELPVTRCNHWDGVSSLVFWSVSHARGWARLNVAYKCEVFMCRHCGGIHLSEKAIKEKDYYREII